MKKNTPGRAGHISDPSYTDTWCVVVCGAGSAARGAGVPPSAARVSRGEGVDTNFQLAPGGVWLAQWIRLLMVSWPVVVV